MTEGPRNQRGHHAAWIHVPEGTGRAEDAVIGRFISADPYVTDPVNSQDWNPYSYVYNNPMSYTDPTGFNAKCLTDPEAAGCSSGGGGGGGGSGSSGVSPPPSPNIPPITITGTYDGLTPTDIVTVVQSFGHSGGGGAAPPKTPAPAPQTNQPPKTLPTIVITPRMPDFAHISFSIPIENEFTGLYLGIGFTLTVDRYGDVYVSVNGLAGLPTAKGRSGMVGWMNDSSTPSQSQLSGMLSGWGGGAQVGYGGLGVGFYGNSSGTSESGGYSTPGASVYGGYTWEIPSLSPLHW